MIGVGGLYDRGKQVTRLAVRFFLMAAVGGALACIQYVSPPTEATVSQQLAAVEGLYADTRDLYFALTVAEAGGSGRSGKGVSVTELRGSWEALRDRASERLAAIDPEALGGEDRRAWESMRQNLTGDSPPSIPETEPCPGEKAAWPGDAASLAAVLQRCRERAASALVVGRDPAQLGTILTRLGSDTSRTQRKALFEALRPLWEEANGANTPLGPWRQLQRLQATRWRAEGLPSELAARSLGMTSAQLEPALVAMLEAWRRQIPDSLVEPWDWWFVHGVAGRRLSRGLTVRELDRITEAYYASFGASPMTLGVRFDLTPRAGKSLETEAYFGGLSRRTRDGPQGAEPVVLASFREGGFAHLAELLGATGRAIHMMAIDTRPAFADLPDSRAFSEALAQLSAMEAYEGAWQVKFLGDSAQLGESLRLKYSHVMFDVSLALFELRLQRDPSRDPNAEWASIAERYLRIVPHPEWSWWAMDGSVVSHPGVATSRALGAMVAADLRAEVLTRRKGFVAGGPALYDWLAKELYQYGRSRPSREVLERFTGHTAGPGALIQEVTRIRQP